MKYPIEGSCQCGQVTYTLHKPPKMVQACHCTECRKLSTSPFSVTAIIDVDDIEFRGNLKEWSRVADSGNLNVAKFCPDCGNRIYHYNPAAMETVKLKLIPVNVDDDTVFEPKRHVWVQEKVSWYQLPEGIKLYDTQPG